MINFPTPEEMRARFESKLMHSTPFCEVGRYTYGQPKIVVTPSSPVTRIGSFCAIADDVELITAGEHDFSRITTYPLNVMFADPSLPWVEHSRGPIVIGNDVWIGRGAVILSGVTVGDGAVIGAHSVVTRDVAPYHIAAGNPARTIRPRFDQATIDRMLQLRWWDWPEEQIRQQAGELLAPPVEQRANETSGGGE